MYVHRNLQGGCFWFVYFRSNFTCLIKLLKKICKTAISTERGAESHHSLTTTYENKLVVTWWASTLLYGLFFSSNILYILWHGSWKTGTVEPEETAVASKRPINMFLQQWTRDATMENCCKWCFLLCSPQGYIRRTNWSHGSAVKNVRDIWNHELGARESPAGFNISRRHCWDLLPGNK
jgi:hypothetical protein